MSGALPGQRGDANDWGASWPENGLLRMRIALDAKWYHRGPPSGRRVVRALAHELVTCLGSSELALILRDDPALIEDGALRACDAILVAGRLPGWQNALRGGRWLQKLRADIGFFQYFVPTLSRVPTVAHIHDILFLTHPSFFTLTERAYLRPLAWNAGRADSVVTVSWSERDRILNAKLAEPERTFVVYNGVDPCFQPLESRAENDPAVARMQARLPGDFVLYTGRINARKNVSTLMRAMTKLGAQAPPLVIAGQPDWRQEGLAELRKELMRDGRLVELGGLSDEDLAATYALATVFCYPSKEEAFGLPNLEAMASGVPVVTSCIPAHREVCGDAAMMFDPTDAEGLAAELEQLLHDDGLRARCRTAGFARSEQFRWSTAARQLLCVFSATLGRA